jgi:anti-sigma B factor antagonist
MSFFIKVTQDTNLTRVFLSGECTIYQVSSLKTKLQELLGSSEAVSIDLSEISDFDSSCLQLFLSLKKTAIRANKKVSFVAHSEPVLSVFGLFGLIGAFEDKVVIKKEMSLRVPLSYGLKKYPNFMKIK